MSQRIHSVRTTRPSAAPLGLAAGAVCALLLSGHVTMRAQNPSCTPPTGNPIVCENQLTGAPASEWDISGSGDDSIQGFATDISVNQGGTIQFKVDTNAAAYHIDIYRLGYYAGLGARKIATVTPSATLPQNQPACLTNSSTGLVDCGNWAVSASWTVPADVTSGIYIGKLVRPDTGGSSHMVFVVRDDTSHSDILFQASDTTWQAYNDYGGNSLYVGQPDGRAYKVSYNRPFVVRGNPFKRTWLFSDEYPMLRWLEANGYSVSYSTGVDTDRRGAELLEHRVFLSVGHDEYWSGTQRANVEAARAAGVHLAFFSGNEVFWKTRWENSIDASSVPYRTLVSYKETHANGKIDPLPNVWTGTWRDARFSPPADGGRPENALTGTIFMGNCCAAEPLTISAAEGQLRFWRNTPLASLTPGTSTSIATGIVGYEFDAELDNGFRPAGLMRLSTTNINYGSTLLDNGSTYGAGAITHALTLYRHGSGALVFGAGTNRWSWALDTNHDADGATPNILLNTVPTIQQATVNLFADMTVQPLTLQSGLISSQASADTVAPASTIVSPQSGTVPPFSSVLISGTAVDSGGGHVSAVEVSVDGGATWHRATGTANWTYNWGTGPAHSATLLSRAVDDSGNVEAPGSGVTMTVSGTVTCPCSIWPSYQVPTVTANQEAAALELGVKFQTDTAGFITGIRYFKSDQNVGVHTGSLWTNTGTLLRTATFTSETTTGWQQVQFSSPVAVSANTTYVASYHTDAGFYSADVNYFATQGFDNGPLHALSQGVSAGNGVFRYGATAFPNSSFNATNYWVDVVFTQSTGSDTTPPTVVSTVPAPNAIEASRTLPITATFSEVLAENTVSSATFELRDATNILVPATVSYAAGSGIASLQPSAFLTPNAIYTATLKGGSNGIKDMAGNPLNADYTWSFTTSTEEYSIWPSTAVPSTTVNDATAIELGLKFRASVDGFITGIRFYKSSTNTGVHTGSLWNLAGSVLGTVTFTNESPSGWQRATLDAPVAVTANTTYIVSYHSPVGVYSADSAAFVSAGVVNGPLEALSNAAAAGNGVYHYGATALPTDTFNSTNYWVDVVFTTSTGTDTTPPTVTARTPVPGATNVAVTTAVTATFSENLDAATVTPTTVELRDSQNGLIGAAVSYASGTRTATLQPSAVLASSATYTARLRGGATGIKDAAGNALASDVTWTFTTAAPADTTPPTVTGTTPANGNTTASLSQPVTATFSEAIAANTVSNATFELRNPANALVSATVTYAAGTATLQPGAALAPGATYTATLRGGLNGIKDLSGNPLATDYIWSFTTASQEYSIWPTTVVPSGGAINDGTSIELGLKFRTTIDGFITGIRFYKASTNTGVHTGSLWTVAGALLGTVTFTNETASGWQQATLSAPVAVTANTTYVVSYHTPLGIYSGTSGAFANVGVTNGPLEALSNAAAGGNGVYKYGSTAFPTDTFNSANYWVDVVFAPGTTPPTVPTISIGDVTLTEGDTGTINAVFAVTLSEASGQSVSVNYVTANGTAVAPGDYTTTSGTVTFAAGVTSRPITVPVVGDLLDEANETFVVNLSVPTNATIADAQGVATITDNEPPPSLAINDVTVTEGNSGSLNAVFTVTMSVASGQSVSVNYATGNGTAVAPADYTTTSGTVTFAAGVTTRTIAVPVRGDLSDEVDETFVVNLSGAINATIADTQGVGTITDNDGFPSLAINNVTVTEGNTGTVNAVFTVTMSVASGVSVSVNYTTADGTAGAPADYTTTAGTLTFAAGSTTQQITVPVVGDVLDEASETYVVNLSGATNATIADTQGVGTINDNDPTPTLVINDVTVAEGNAGTVNAVFTVTLSAISARTVTVNYATANNTAVAPADYTTTSGTLTFLPGSPTTQQITVQVAGDLLDEPNETVYVNLSGAVNGSIADSRGVATITDDDPTPSLVIDDVTVTEGNTGTVTAVFTVTLSAISGRTVTVNYATANSTAIAGTTGDYLTRTGTLTFAAGSTTTQTIAITVNGDTLVEANEAFFVNLSGASNATISDNRGVGTILNND